MNLRTLWLMVIMILANSYSHAATYPYLQDDNTQADAPHYAGDYPKIALSETQSDNGSIEAWTKYDVIGAKGGMMNKIAAAQAINPGLRYHFSVHPISWVGHVISDPCSNALAMPFGSTAAASGDCAMYAGHWLYKAGTLLSSSMSTTSLTLRVQNATHIQAGDYVVIYDSPAGSFNNAEHAEVASVNRSTSPHTVTLRNRGYKSTAKSHSANSIVAAHEIGTGGSKKQWSYNLALGSPRDANNRTASQVIADWIPANMNRDGNGRVTSIRVDGVFFDEDGYVLNATDVDANNDLVVDNGILSDGTHIWGDGLEQFYQQVRNRLPNHIIMSGWREGRGFKSLSGGQMENWLVTGGDFAANPTYTGNSGALSQLHNYLIHTQFHAANEGYTEVTTKNPTRLYPYSIKSGSNPTIPPDNSHFRFSFGAALLSNGHYSRQNSDYHPDPWHDEYAVDITPGSSTYGRALESNPSDESEIREHKGWLGQALGPRTRIYDDADFAPQNNLIDNGGFEQGSPSWATKNVTSSIDTSTKMGGAQSLRINGHQNFAAGLGGADVRGPQFNMVKGQQYTVAFSAKSSKVRNIYVRLDWSANQGYFLVPTRWTRFVYTVTATASGTFRPIFYVGREDTTVWLDDVYIFEGDPNVFKREFDNGLVIVNATPNQKTVDLGGTYERILGTGQDAINNGASVSSVAIAAWDAAILVRPDGSSPSTPTTSPTPTTPPPPSTGGTCGAPTINVSGTPAIYAWADTCKSGTYHVTGTSNGPLRNYVGSIVATSPISSVSETLIESADDVSLGNNSELFFELNVWNGEDSFGFSTASGADVCLVVSGGTLLVGAGADPMASGINLRTMKACNADSSSTAEKPSDATAENPAIYAWVDEQTGRIHVRGTSNGPRRNFSGRLEASGIALASMDSIESHDSVIKRTGEVSFQLSVWEGKDEFSVSAPGGPVCLTLDPWSDGPLKLGADTTELAGSVDLRTGQPCQ